MQKVVWSLSFLPTAFLLRTVIIIFSLLSALKNYITLFHFYFFKSVTWVFFTFLWFCIILFSFFCFIFIVYISRYVISKSCQTVSINSKNKYIFYLLCYSFFNVMRTMVISSVYWHSLSPIIILISCFTNSIIAVKFSCFCSNYKFIPLHNKIGQ